MIALDTETEPFSAGRMAPPIVCIQYTDGQSTHVVHVSDAKSVMARMLTSDELIIGHNIAYDMACILAQWPELVPLVFAKYDRDQITDTMCRAQLDDIATGLFRQRQHVKGWYSLAGQAKLHGYPVDLDKETWRMGYKELKPFPVSQWPRGAVEYCEHDATSTLHVYRHQNGSPDEYRQARAAFALHLTSAWGLRTDPVMVSRQRRLTEDKLKGFEVKLIQDGYLVTEKGKLKREVKKMHEYIRQHFQDYPKTDTGKPSISADALDYYRDDLIEAFQGYGGTNTFLSRVEEVEKGLILPIHTRYHMLVTGRTSSSGPNVQNRPRALGDRECFVPRKGNVFIDIDYNGLELCTLAQVCLDLLHESKLAEAINRDEDPHLMVAAQLLRIPLDAAKQRKKDKSDHELFDHRQLGKIANFGLGGGMGVKRFIDQARTNYDVTLDRATAQRLVNTWHTTWPEMRRYFNMINNMQSYDGLVKRLTHVRSGRVKANSPYTEACNSFFQGLGADVAKASLYDVVKATFCGDLVGCHVGNFIHDQILVEAPEDWPEAAQLVQTHWVGTAQEWLEGVKVSAEPVRCRRWSKLAAPTIDGSPWEWEEAILAGSKGHAE